MAIYVGIKRLNANDEFAEYSFGPNDEERGRLRIHKQSGEIEVLEQVAGDESKKYSMRAARKLTLHFRANEFPEVTCFAS